MLKAGIIGLGKMGISHAAIIGAHHDVELAAVCDTSSLVLDAFKKFSFGCDLFVIFTIFWTHCSIFFIFEKTPGRLEFFPLFCSYHYNVSLR